MLFMTIITWEPENRDKVRKAYAAPGHESSKEIGVWSDIGGCRAFRLSEEANTMDMYEGARRFNDVATVEIIPVVESKELMKAITSKK